jgi:hypothetical protein
MSYAIVYKNERVVLGPVDWSQKYFTDILDIHFQVKTHIPYDAPKELPYIINDDFVIHKVFQDLPILLNPKAQELQGPNWDFSKNPIVCSYSVVELPMDRIKNNYKDLTASVRYKKENTTIRVEIQNTIVFIDTHRELRNQYTQKYLNMQDNSSINWKFGNKWLTLTKQDLSIIINAIDRYVQSSFDWEKNICGQIDSATTVDNLENIENEELIIINAPFPLISGV